MEYITIQIQKTDHLRKTPVSQDDMKELLGMLGFSETAMVEDRPRRAIASATIAVSRNAATVHWADEPGRVAA
jgi:hypothetical protein